MNIEIVKVGYLETNCYILRKENKVIVIDPGSEPDKIKTKIGQDKIEAILLTHSHFDHIGALSSFKDIKVYSINNLKEQEYKIGNFIFKVIYTKGHTSDSITYYFEKEKIMFTGDFLFKESIGFIDEEKNGNMLDMNNSINLIKKYDKNIIIYPGHGDKTILEEELENNPFF